MTNSSSVNFNKKGAPYNSQLDDIYFDVNTGLAQHKNIFIEGNDITRRLLSNNEPFTIAETSFGNGLNFLLTLQAYQEIETHLLLQSKNSVASPKLANLTFISVEKYPLSQEELKSTLSVLPELTSIYQPLIEQYPSGDTAQFPSQCQIVISL